MVIDFGESGRVSNEPEASDVHEVEVIDEVGSEQSRSEEASQDGADEVSATSGDELSALRDEVAHLREMYLRKLAEFDNFRKRVERERQEMKRTAAEELVLDLIPVLDNFERALEQEVDADSNAFREGVNMISRQLQGVLEKRGLEQFDPIGTPFQPELHEAVQQIDDSELPPGTVAWVLARGYLYGGRLLRPAMVGVTRGEAGNGGGGTSNGSTEEEDAS